jgi:DNA-binding CsgD family transcriptional regulator
VDRGTIGHRVGDAARVALVGREPERERLLAWTDDPSGPAVVFVHGPGGIGKTTLVSGSFDPARVVMVGAGEVEPTPARLLDHLGRLLGVVGDPTPESIGAEMTTQAVDVVVIDEYERFVVVDAFVRNELLPALPSATTTVLVGRNPPNRAWRTSPGWRSLIAELALGPLTDTGAARLVERRLGNDAALVARACRFGRGHPLALELAAEAIARRPELTLRGGPPPEVVEELVEVFVDELDGDVRRAVDAGSLVRRLTMPVLATLCQLGENEVRAAWRHIAGLPFVAVYEDGLRMQPVVQDVVASSFELRDPVLVRSLRRRAAALALDSIGKAPDWAATADLLHLVQNPVVRDAFVPPAGAQHPVEVARADDQDPVLQIVRRYCGRGEVRMVDAWWRSHPRGFVVARGDDGEVTSFSLVVDVAAIAGELAGLDPVVQAVQSDLRVRPLRAGGRALLKRHGLTMSHGDALCPELALMIIDLKRTYLEMRPDLLRVYVAIPADGPLVATMHGLGFSLVERCNVEDCAVELWTLQMPDGSVDEWLGQHIEFETSPVQLDASVGPAPAISAVATLSPREREVISALADGLTNQQLAERLFISERTANRHISNIFTKLGVHNRTAAARIALEAGLTG